MNAAKTDIANTEPNRSQGNSNWVLSSENKLNCNESVYETKRPVAAPSRIEVIMRAIAS